MNNTQVVDVLSEIRYARQQLEDPNSTVRSIWREEPIALREFVESEKYCNLPPLTTVQYEAAIAILGEDAKNTFDPEKGTSKSIAVLLWGKGSGKDYLTSILQLYCIYIVLCLKEPQKYFNQAPGENLDIINVAYNASQARNVYFTKFLERLKRCAWFRKRFNIVQSGRVLGKRKKDAWGDVSIGMAMVIFPGNIRAISESSENESYEGYNILVWIMDEASAFRSAKRVENANGIYNTLRTSANTRFVRRWKGFVLSYPRSEDDWDFTTKLYKESLKFPDTMYGSREFSWNVAPPATYPGPRFRFVYDRPDQRIEIDIPELLREDFEKNPEESLAKYCCMPGLSQGKFFEQPGSLPRIFSDRKPLFYTDIIIVESHDVNGGLLFKGIGHRISRWNEDLIDDTKQYVAHIDVGLTGDRAALVLAHGEPILVEYEYNDGHKEQRWSQKIVEDVHVVYEPDKKRNLRVSISNIESLLAEISEHVKLVVVTYDHWQSAGSVENLAMKSILAKEHNINRNDYDLLKSVIYAGDIDLLYDPLTELELSELRKTMSGTVDHPAGGSKDLADALAGVTRLILGETKEMKNTISEPVNLGMPVAATAYAHKSANNGNEFQLGPVNNASMGGGITATTGRANRFPTSKEPILMPDIPPMPFGIGTVQPRPNIVLLPSSGSRSGKGGSSSSGINSIGSGSTPLEGRMKELK